MTRHGSHALSWPSAHSDQGSTVRDRGRGRRKPAGRDHRSPRHSLRSAPPFTDEPRRICLPDSHCVRAVRARRGHARLAGGSWTRWCWGA